MENVHLVQDVHMHTDAASLDNVKVKQLRITSTTIITTAKITIIIIIITIILTIIITVITEDTEIMVRMVTIKIDPKEMIITKIVIIGLTITMKKDHINHPFLIGGKKIVMVLIDLLMRRLTKCPIFVQ